MRRPSKSMGSPPIIAYILFLIVIDCFLLPLKSEATEYRGRFSLEDLYLSDTSSALERHQLSTRLAIDPITSNEKDTLGLHLDVMYRKTISGEDSGTDLKDERINQFNIEYNSFSNGIYFAAGRLWPRAFGGERVDGINLLYRKGAGGIGIFGGAKPDPYTDGFNSGFTSAGTYLFYNEKDLNGNLAFVHNGYKGKTDRQYVYSRLMGNLHKDVRFFSIITADRDERGKRLKLSNGIIELTYQPRFNKSITIGYNEFRAFTLLESMNYEIDSSLQRSYYVRGHYHFFDRYVLYGKYEKQYLEYETAPSQEANIRQVGFSNNSLFGTTARFDINTVTGDREDTYYRSYVAELGFNLTDKLQLTLNASTVKTEYDVSKETDEQKSYLLAAYYRYSKKWNFIFNYEQIKGEGYESKTALSKVVYKF